ncbi:hypothetical protein PGT21_005844 [Puccinia graminis f. sp. tritici]|uniref:Uncharacterized protein n=1 Tax=Puccinia graminis f. sp. tritici TaxID=56615 RepID=A0A5B0Q1U7_PUCGR|nr:hypothetical protein PGT21_005844 [Puccinia graminis f. sp. tritici]
MANRFLLNTARTYPQQTLTHLNFNHSPLLCSPTPLSFLSLSLSSLNYLTPCSLASTTTSNHLFLNSTVDHSPRSNTISRTAHLALANLLFYPLQALYSLSEQFHNGSGHKQSVKCIKPSQNWIYLFWIGSTTSSSIKSGLGNVPNFQPLLIGLLFRKNNSTLTNIPIINSSKIHHLTQNHHQSQSPDSKPSPFSTIRSTHHQSQTWESNPSPDSKSSPISIT